MCFDLGEKPSLGIKKNCRVIHSFLDVRRERRIYLGQYPFPRFRTGENFYQLRGNRVKRRRHRLCVILPSLMFLNSSISISNLGSLLWSNHTLPIIRGPASPASDEKFFALRNGDDELVLRNPCLLGTCRNALWFLPLRLRGSFFFRG